MRFNRRDVRLALGLNVLLVALLILSFGSGWIALSLGLSEFGLHKWSSIALTVAIVIHICLHYKLLIRRRPKWRPPVLKL